MIEMIGNENRKRKQYCRLNEEDKKTYHKDYMRKYREDKMIYWMRVQRGLEGRYIDEKQLFNKNDYDYLKSLN
jgi:hypothetical protein